MFIVRIAKNEEWEKVLALYESMIDAMQDKKYKPGWKKGIYPSKELVRNAIEKKELYIGVLDGEFAAAMILNHNCTDGYEKAEWKTAAKPEEITVVHALGVSPNYQRQGLAKQMIEDAARSVSKAGQKAIRLDVLAKNLSAKEFYEAIGFQCCGLLELYYVDTGLTEFYLYEMAIG